MLYAPGRYNLNYDISAILLNVIIMIFFLTKKKVRDRRVRLFMSLESSFYASPQPVSLARR